MSLKRHSTTVPIKILAVSRYIPDLLTEVTCMAALTAKVLKGTVVERFLFVTIKYDDTCFEAKVSGYSNKSRSPYTHIAYVIR